MYHLDPLGNIHVLVQLLEASVQEEIRLGKLLDFLVATAAETLEEIANDHPPSVLEIVLIEDLFHEEVELLLGGTLAEWFVLRFLQLLLQLKSGVLWHQLILLVFLALAPNVIMEGVRPGKGIPFVGAHL